MNAKKAQQKRGYKIIKQKQNRCYAERQEQQKEEKSTICLVSNVRFRSLTLSINSPHRLLPHGGW